MPEPDRLQERSHTDAEDLLAVQRTLNGDPRAFGGIVQRHTPSVYTLALRMLDDPEEAEEAVQEIFLKAYRHLGRFQIQRRLHPWLYTIAINHLRGVLRKRRRRRAPAERDVDSLADPRSDGASDPQAAAVRAEGERLAAAALGELRREYREVFVLRQVQGLSVREVAEILGIPEGTVKTNLHRARRRLIELLAEKDWDPE
ncbi:MAG: sigma-70 family RNA polymerase sigma factor [Spirochaetales bacterium]|nr:sigma-70 family RNA polymerase sigma factor [Spirochaetales bacterium]